MVEKLIIIRKETEQEETTDSPGISLLNPGQKKKLGRQRLSNPRAKRNLKIVWKWKRNLLVLGISRTVYKIMFI